MSAFAFKGKQEGVRRIAEALGVAHVLEGSVRKAGKRIRVTAQLIAACDGSHLWSERYDRELADVFAVQDEIAQAIATVLQVKLAGKPAPIRRHTPPLPAYGGVPQGAALLRQANRRLVGAGQGLLRAGDHARSRVRAGSQLAWRVLVHARVSRSAVAARRHADGARGGRTRPGSRSFRFPKGTPCWVWWPLLTITTGPDRDGDSSSPWLTSRSRPTCAGCTALSTSC